MISSQAKHISDKINNVEAHLPGNISNQLNSAKKQLEYTRLKNKTLLDRRQQQGFVKNLLDVDSRKAQKEVNNAKKKLMKMKDQKHKLTQSTLMDLTVDLDRTKATKKMIEDASGITDMKGNVEEMQRAYDKAVRSTRNTRMATIGSAGVGGYKVNQVRKKKNDSQEPKYNYYATGLNNEYQ